MSKRRAWLGSETQAAPGGEQVAEQDKEVTPQYEHQVKIKTQKKQLEQLAVVVDVKYELVHDKVIKIVKKKNGNTYRTYIGNIKKNPQLLKQADAKDKEFKAFVEELKAKGLYKEKGT